MADFAAELSPLPEAVPIDMSSKPSWRQQRLETLKVHYQVMGVHCFIVHFCLALFMFFILCALAFTSVYQALECI